jgi:hypothetical protein
MQRTSFLLAILAFSAIVSAQSTIVIPNGFATTEGSTNNAFPWASSSTAWPGLRTIQIYGPTNFTAQSVSGPMVITRLRWRADGSATTWTGGTFSTATVRMATAAVPYSAPSTNIPSNFGPDLTTVYTGPVTFLPGSGGSPGPWVVDITLTSPFPYDPTNGGLAIDCDINNSGGIVYSGGTTPQLDVDASPNTQASRVYISAAYPAANGTTYPHGNIIEVTYTTGPGSALLSSYGAGCGGQNGLPFYEFFATAPTFDLANSGVSMIFDGNKTYTVLPGFGTFVPPSGSATVVANGDDVDQIVTLASPFPCPSGPTTSLTVCSNGFVSVGGNGTSYTPTTAGFLAFGQTCFCACWHDFNPTAAGSGQIKFEEVGNVSYVTWSGVYDFGGTSSANANTFQYQFDRGTGIVHIIWQTMSTLGNGFLTGFKPSGPYTDPGPIDISTALPSTITCRGASLAMVLAASARPIIGTSINLVSSQLPGGTTLGANVLSFTQHNPGIDLTPLGMPGCRQFVGLDATNLFIPAGGQGINALVIPNVPAYSGLVLYSQSAAFATGINPLGVVSSNGLALTVGTH